MTFLEQMFAREHPDEDERRSDERRSWAAIEAAFGGNRTASGIGVTPNNALTNTAVLAAVRVIAETVASLPLIVYERLAPRGKQRVPQMPLYGLLHDAPNPLMSSFEFRETQQGHLLLWGNAFAEIESDNRGRIVALWPLRPDKMREIRQDAGRLFYRYELPNGTPKWFAGEQIWHRRGLSSDGIWGYSPITLARQAVGLAMATEKFGAAFFGNGARPGGILLYPGKLDDIAYDRIKNDWRKEHEGLSNAQRITILEEGMSYKEIGTPPEDAQFLETRKFQVTEIARLFRVPPHMLADLERATFSNIEHQALEFVTHSIRPWLVRWEQSIQQQLMLPRERERYFVEFLVDGLLRGDIQSRFSAYATAKQNGWLSADDIRELENQNPIGEENGGNLYLVPLNMIPANQAMSMPISADGQARSRPDLQPIELRGRQAAAMRLRLQQRYVPLFAEVAGRLVRREANDIGNQARKQLRAETDFREWLRQFYEELTPVVQREFSALLTNYATQINDLAAEELGQDAPDIDGFVATYLDEMASRYAGRHRSRLLDVLDKAAADGADVLEMTLAELENWRERQADVVGRDESVRVNNAVALAAYSALGVRRKVWRTMGENCPYCQQLDGRTVALEQFFLKAGESLEEGGQRLTVGGNIGHAPAHAGCDCMIVAG